MSRCPCGKCHCPICGNQMDSLNEPEQKLSDCEKKLEVAVEALGSISENNERPWFILNKSKDALAKIKELK